MCYHADELKHLFPGVDFDVRSLKWLNFCSNNDDVLCLQDLLAAYFRAEDGIIDIKSLLAAESDTDSDLDSVSDSGEDQ